MLDRYWFGAVDRISPEAPVPVVQIARTEDRLGGAANVALNARRLGTRATLMSVIGSDDASRVVLSLLDQADIRPLIGRDEKLNTVVKLRVIGRSQQLLRVDFEHKPDHELLARMLGQYEGVLAESDVVLFSDYGKGGLTHISEMIRMAKLAGKPVLVDPKGADYRRYADATVLTPNRSELAHVVGAWSDEADLRRRVERLSAELNLAALLVTRAEEGMTLFMASGEVHHVPAVAKEVFDVTGAGDTVIAVLAAMVGCGLSLAEAVPIANRAGSIVVGKFGTASVTYPELFS